MSLLGPALSDRPYMPADAASATPSAVLVIIHYHDDRPYVFLTRRSATLKSHRGKYRFPGGRYVQSDGALLAHRAAGNREEIGITFAPAHGPPASRSAHNDFEPLYRALRNNTGRAAMHRIATSEVEAVIDAPSSRH